MSVNSFLTLKTFNILLIWPKQKEWSQTELFSNQWESIILCFSPHFSHLLRGPRDSTERTQDWNPYCVWSYSYFLMQHGLYLGGLSGARVYVQRALEWNTGPVPGWELKHPKMFYYFPCVLHFASSIISNTYVGLFLFFLLLILSGPLWYSRANSEWPDHWGEL